RDKSRPYRRPTTTSLKGGESDAAEARERHARARPARLSGGGSGERGHHRPEPLAPRSGAGRFGASPSLPMPKLGLELTDLPRQRFDPVEHLRDGLPRFELDQSGRVEIRQGHVAPAAPFDARQGAARDPPLDRTL